MFGELFKTIMIEVALIRSIIQITSARATEPRIAFFTVGTIIFTNANIAFRAMRAILMFAVVLFFVIIVAFASAVVVVGLL